MTHCWTCRGRWATFLDDDHVLLVQGTQLWLLQVATGKRGKLIMFGGANENVGGVYLDDLWSWCSCGN